MKYLKVYCLQSGFPTKCMSNEIVEMILKNLISLKVNICGLFQCTNVVQS